MKIENEDAITWESIPESPLMTINNPEYKTQEFNLEEICSKILKLSNLEDLYLFLNFHSAL